MEAATVQLMRDQVLAIYRAVTGTDLVEPTQGEEQTRTEETQREETRVDEEQVARSFADLEALARSVPAVAQRVPPFYFTPPVDVIDSGHELLVEVAVPGIEREDVSVERQEDLLVIRGLRRGERAANGRAYLLAEIPRGTFQRVVPIPAGIDAEPTVEVERGTIYVRLAKTARSSESVAEA